MPIDPLIGRSLISAGTSLAGGILGMFGQQSANQATLAAQREQNAWNERMWRANNEYNDPSAQMERLIKAGISPTLAAQTIQGGNSNAPAQGVAPPQIQNTLSPLGDSISNIGDSLINAYAVDSQAQLNKIRGDNETKETLANILLKGKQAGLADSQKIYQDIINSFQKERSILENHQIRQNIRKNIAEITQLYSLAKKNMSEAEFTRANKKYIELQTTLLPELTQAQIFSLRTNAAAAWQHAVVTSKLAPYQKSVLLSQKAYFANMALNIHHEEQITAIEEELAKQYGIPPKLAIEIISSVLGTISSVAGGFIGGTGATLLRQSLTKPVIPVSGFK